MLLQFVDGLLTNFSCALRRPTVLLLIEICLSSRRKQTALVLLARMAFLLTGDGDKVKEEKLYFTLIIMILVRHDIGNVHLEYCYQSKINKQLRELP